MTLWQEKVAIYRKRRDALKNFINLRTVPANGKYFFPGNSVAMAREARLRSTMGK